ncbi:fungal hydrophobin-domain-containing protein [Daedaleopsis nitida]|nr:fungal hydrophobin-domain-containing protein [Daedaleopsis nitida]
MFARFLLAISLVSVAVLAVATPCTTTDATTYTSPATTYTPPGTSGNPPATSTVTKTETTTITETTTLTKPPITVTEPGTGTCTATAPTVTVTQPANQNCTTGPIQCCESVQSADTVPGKLILGLLGVVLQDLNVLLGLNCNPINVIGVGSGNQCEAVTVCCENNAVGGLISIGCLPIIL